MKPRAVLVRGKTKKGFQKEFFVKEKIGSKISFDEYINDLLKSAKDYNFEITEHRFVEQCENCKGTGWKI